MSITFDPLKLAEKLEISGFSAEQVKGPAYALSEELVMNKDDLATKADLEPLKTELGMIKWMMGGTVFGIFLLVVKTFLV